MYDWNFSVLYSFAPALLSGLWNTLLLTIVSCLLGSVIALVGLFSLIYRPRYTELPIRVVVELIIALPIPIMLVWIYYCLPLVGVALPPFSSAVIALTLSLAAFLIEMIRGILRTIPDGQTEVAVVLGVSTSAIASRIVLPQVLRAAQPGIVSNYIVTLKLSSLAALISAPELLYQANLVIATTYRPLEVYTVVAFVFIAMVLPLTRVQAYLERK
jgi:polar amino acid transport system permease protein